MKKSFLNAARLVAPLLLGALAPAKTQAQGVRVVKAPPLRRSSGFYVGNRAPLQPSPFLKLPPGAITPRGWLRRQLLFDASGLTGRMVEVSDYLKYENNGWVDPKSNNGWEEMPYWLRGYGDLGYVLKDPKMQAESQKWIDGILSAQKPDGYFGPDKLRTAENGMPDLWPHMLILDALHSYYDHSGDPRVIPFMQRYFGWQSTLGNGAYKNGWGALRWADNMAVLYWLYNKTGDASLLELSARIHANSVNWVDNLPNAHNVNIAQGIREPGEFWMQSGDLKQLKAVEQDYQRVMGQFGQVPGGGFAGDENTRAGIGDPRQGFETCGIVEYMHTHEMMTRISGDAVWADRAEELAFNSLPAALTPDHRGIHYITPVNVAELNRKGTRGQFDNHFPMLNYQPGIHNYRCCPHNYGMGWPYYAEEAWLATSDQGVATSLYAASDVSVKVGDGTLVKWSQITDYPFKDLITLKLAAPKTTKFPLYLRIPRWTKGATIALNGKTVKVAATPLSYVVLDRFWKNGDTVTMRFPMQVAVRKWANNKDSVSVDYGPLSFALSPGEQWVRDGGTDRWPEHSVKPTTAWNYGFPTGVKASDFQVVRKSGAISDAPFTPETAPVLLQTRARRVPGWQSDSQGIVATLQASPARSSAPLEPVTLVPMGAARLRIAQFPTTSSSPEALDWSLNAPKVPLIDVSASHSNDDPDALVDGVLPVSSAGAGVPRFTWWDHRGTKEWASLEFKAPRRVSSVSLYWFDDTGRGECRVPASARLFYRDGETWKPLPGAVGVSLDKFNTLAFPAVTTSALRLEVQLSPNVSGGILEWKVGD